MSQKKSVGVNAALNVIKQCCAIIFPLITFPYVSRILGATNYGKINFSNSIVSYFSLIAALGISSYAIREGARIRDNKKKFQIFASEIFTINVITTIIAYISLICLAIFWGKLHSYWNLLIVQSLTIILTTIGADWVNTVNEDYLYITLRYIAAQILSLCSMFAFVRTADDYVIYAIIHTLSSAGAYILNVFYIRKYVHLKITRHPNIKKHIKPIFVFFGNALSSQIYLNSDTTILGVLIDDLAVGVYSAGSKIYGIVKNLLNAMVTVVIPRASVLLGENRLVEYNNLLNKIFYAIISLLMPTFTGLFMLSYEVIFLFGGVEYAQGYLVLRILSIALVFATFANFYCNAILVPNKKEKRFLQGTIIAATVNIVLNFIFIPLWSYNGAAVTTVLAEIIICLTGIKYSKGLFELKRNRNNILSCIIGCVTIVIICTIFKVVVENIYIRICICVSVSIIFYFIILYIFKNQTLIYILEIFKNRLKKNSL